MADYTADYAAGFVGGALTKRTGTAAADTVAAGSFVVWVNAGAGAHTVTLTSNNTYQGLGISSRVITIAAGGAWGGKIDPLAGDANGRVAVAINGTATEVTYYVLGGTNV
jgi:plastocyanin